MKSLPRGEIVDRIMSISDIKTYSHSRDYKIGCYRCGESDHMRSECLYWRTRLCTHYIMGNCPRVSCPFAHGTDQLRRPWKTRARSVLPENFDR